MPMVNLYRLHTDVLEKDKAKLQEIADHINTCYPELKVYIYDIERDSSEVEEVYDNDNRINKGGEKAWKKKV